MAEAGRANDATIMILLDLYNSVLNIVELTVLNSQQIEIIWARQLRREIISFIDLHSLY